jgi:hypothetical protein
MAGTPARTLVNVPHMARRGQIIEIVLRVIAASEGWRDQSAVPPVGLRAALKADATGDLDVGVNRAAGRNSNGMTTMTRSMNMAKNLRQNPARAPTA